MALDSGLIMAKPKIAYDGQDFIRVKKVGRGEELTPNNCEGKEVSELYRTQFSITRRKYLGPESKSGF